MPSLPPGLYERLVSLGLARQIADLNERRAVASVESPDRGGLSIREPEGLLRAG